MMTAAEVSAVWIEQITTDMYRPHLINRHGVAAGMLTKCATKEQALRSVAYFMGHTDGILPVPEYVTRIN